MTRQLDSPSLRNIIPDRLNDPARFALTAERHRNAFRWVQQDWIPLGVIVNDPAHSAGLSYDDWLEPEAFLALQAKMLRDTLEAGSDINPTIALNHTGNALYSSVFGAEITIPHDEVTSIQDIGPWILPILSDIEEVDGLVPPKIPCGMMDHAERFMRFYREHLPEWVRVVSPSKIGPFSLAALLRGWEFYLDVAADPERSRRLVEVCAETLIAVEAYFRDIADETDDCHYSEFGIAGPGMRLGADSIVSVSPDAIRQLVLPSVRRMAGAFGGRAYLHFCSLQNSRCEHVYEALRDDPVVFATSSQFGFEYYEQHVDELAGRLAIESLYGDALPYIERTHGSFEAWAKDFVPRFKGRSGLVLYFEVSSAEEAKHYWSVWQAAHTGCMSGPSSHDGGQAALELRRPRSDRATPSERRYAANSASVHRRSPRQRPGVRPEQSND